ncbi:MAG: hypothetical protein ACI9C1_001888 [Candidatus Aldehydirespiratoraceae bacterium]
MSDPVPWILRARPNRLRSLGRLSDGERLIGLLMIRDEDDVLNDTLLATVRWFDRIYVLDGTTDPQRVERTDAILARFPEVRWHTRDAEHFPTGVTDGARQVLLDRVRDEQGTDNWIGVLHADEFLDQDPRPMLAARHPSANPSIRVRVAHTFLHVDDETKWDSDERVMRDKVTHQMWPGVPEARFFFDDGSRDFNVDKHSKVVPQSHRPGELVDGYVITQYNERSPELLVARARQRAASGWQVGHYARLLGDSPEVFVDSLDRPDSPFAAEFASDPEGPFRPALISEMPHGPCARSISVAVETELTDVAELANLSDEGRAFRRFGCVAKPGGLVDLAERGTRRQQRLAVRGLRRSVRTAASSFDHRAPIAGADALLRHTSRVVRSRRTTQQQRSVALSECVVRLANAGSGDAGWFTIVPANRRPAVLAFLDHACVNQRSLDQPSLDREECGS